jgi:hypothetical protein
MKKETNNHETIAVTVYSVITKTVFVDIYPNLTHDEKVQLINEIAIDIYEDETDNNNEDVYEKVSDVRYCEIDFDDYDSNFSAIKNSDGVYELSIN